MQPTARPLSTSCRTVSRIPSPSRCAGYIGVSGPRQPAMVGIPGGAGAPVGPHVRHPARVVDPVYSYGRRRRRRRVRMATTMPVGLLGGETWHARVEDIKRRKGSAPWGEKVVVNEQMSGTLICQPPGHDTDRLYHLTDEWWVVLEGEIDWQIEGRTEIVHARAGDIVFAPARHYHHIR